MAAQASPYYPTRKDYQILGLNKVFDKIQQMLLGVLLWGTPSRRHGQCFSDYLINTKGMKENELRKVFNKGQRDKLKKDPHMNSFDVTLTYMCLKYGTDDLASPNDDKWQKMDTLEGRLTSAKNHRNDFAHKAYEINDQLYHDKIKEIRSLITIIISEAAHHFHRDQGEIDALLKDFNEELDKIIDLPKTPSRLTFEEMCTLLRYEGSLELKEIYEDQSSLSPASNLLGGNILVKVKQIFTKLEIQEAACKQLLPVDRLFEYVHSLNSKKNLLLVEGVAGAGKTTLTRMILQEWSEGSSKMKNLDSYDLAIWTECRDNGTPSLAHLLRSLMPITTQKIQGDAQVITCLQKNDLLFVIDGLDELNASSERVFREILGLKNTDVITIICTTRPNKVPDIKKYVPDIFEIQHVMVIGIAEEDREKFVRSYSQALESYLGIIDTSDLLHFLKRNENRLQEHWRLPFNLVLVTILWFQDPNAVNAMTTATELFLKTFELCKERLIQRLHDNEKTSRMSLNDIQQNLTFFVKEMANVAFASHCNDETVLSQTSLDSLKEACHRKSLPPEEVMSSFLVQAVSLINKNLEKFSFPHKGLQDFFCALHIEQVLEHENANLNIPRILSSIEQILLENTLTKSRVLSVLHVCNDQLNKIQRETSSTCPTVWGVFQEALRGVAIINPTQDVQLNLSKWRNILVHLTGLLHHRGRSLTNERAEEMVKLLEESGITDSDEWFDFLSNVKCDAAISKHIVVRGIIKVTDARVEAFLKVLGHAEPTRVDIAIKGDPSVTHGLKELLVALHEKELRVFLHHDFRFPKEGGSILEGTILHLFRASLGLREFKGQLSAFALKKLPSNVAGLQLSVKDGAHLRSLLEVLTSREEEEEEEPMTMKERMMMMMKRVTRKKRSMKVKRLDTLVIHVPVDIDESALRPLPRVPYLRLFVSDVSEATAEKASLVASALLPSEGRYSRLLFPGVGRTPRACEQLLQGLGRRGVEVPHGVIVSPSMEERETQDGGPRGKGVEVSILYVE